MKNNLRPLRQFTMMIISALLCIGFLAGCTVSSDISQETVSDEKLLSAMRFYSFLQPWGETQSLSVATESSEVDFVPPSEDALPGESDPVPLLTYRYMTGTVEALYRDEEKNTELRIRKSTARSGEELVEEYRRDNRKGASSSEEARKETFDDLTVYCLGDGDLTEIAWFTKTDGNYAIIYTPGTEDSGLSEGELKTLVSAL
ncbi:MAG: hypothetical protein K5985_12180 [Lachnospiraceae bacterium]|nr:hypothetical protein [Lachnospiraceae bacterium]